MRIGIDIDNVIADLDKTFLEEFEKEDKNKRNKGIINKKAKHITEGMFDWSSEEIEDFICNNMDRMAEKFDLIEDAKEYINKLYEESEIFLITHRSNHFFKNHELVTINWLNEKGIKYDKLVFTKSRDKSPECIENSIDIMFDDEADKCKYILNAGIECFLMKTRYNENYSLNIPIVNGWKEIYSLICEKNKYNVILDTDTYNEADDQFALSYLLKSKEIFNIDAITIAPFRHEKWQGTVSDSIDASYNEACKVFDLLGLKDKSLIYKGSRDYLKNGYNERNSAVNKIIEIANKNKKTYILAIGCLTNIALALKSNPDIIDKIEIVWLGSNFLFGTNKDFNFDQDVEAVKVVFESKVKLTVMPCSPITSNLMTSIYELESELKGKNELCDYLCYRFYNRAYGPTKRWPLWDISVIAYMINKNWFNTMEVSCPLINTDNTFKLTENRHSIKFVNYLNANEIFKDLFSKLTDNN